MNLAGIRRRSETPWWDDHRFAVQTLLRDVIATCARYDQPAVGTLTVQTMETHPGFAPDEGVRWEFRPCAP